MFETIRAGIVEVFTTFWLIIYQKMSSVQFSDDDDSFDQVDLTNIQEQAGNFKNPEEVICLSSDEDTIPYLTSDEEELPEVDVKRRAVIKKLFPTKPVPSTAQNFPKPCGTSTTSKHNPRQVSTCPKAVAEPAKMIGGIKVNLPVEPYGSQMVLMFKLITAMNKSQNCLLESPTGSGKTLALLCAALAWQLHEKTRIAQSEAQLAMTQFPQLGSYEGAMDFISSPQKEISPEKLFGKPSFGGRSIYDSPQKSTNVGDASTSAAQQPYSWNDSPHKNEVTIHNNMKRKLDGAGSSTSPRQPSTPEKTSSTETPETPPSVKTPIIYYGARTHKQLQQVIKEFSRTKYCGLAKMTVLSSRDYSCIREFDKDLWPTKNDMCRGCVKKVLTDFQKKSKEGTNCIYYDNVKALDHSKLPPAFDLEDLVAEGKEIMACPYYAARHMAQVANIVFCPYNYLIEPTIRASLNIDLQGNIVIIDEAHNIEDICRDAATFTITQDNVQLCMKELEYCTQYRYANQDSLHYLDMLLKTLRDWDQWFVNQRPLVSNKPINNNEAAHVWETNHFVQTLDNHNIGQKHYSDFAAAAEVLIQNLRDNPGKLYGVTQATGTLIENINVVLGYLFCEDGKYREDFKPVLIRTVQASSELSFANGWRNSQFNKCVEKEFLSLRLLCLNPAVVFSSLKTARCICLASGTLTPLHSLHSELATEFPLRVSPNHVIPQHRVWIGTLTTCPNGEPLECTSRGTEQTATQDALGETIRWVCQVTPHGVLCFMPSYALMNRLYKRWRETGLWSKLTDLKDVFMESRNVRDHNNIMEEFYQQVSSGKGALLLAVYRGKVSEGMDFKDHQARAVITIGVPYPSLHDLAVKEKMKYNDKYAAAKQLLSSREWLRVQAYRALNQAVGRCVRHRADWGAVLLVDARFTQPYYTDHLSKWVRAFLGSNHHTYESLVTSNNSLESFMQAMTIAQNEDMQ